MSLPPITIPLHAGIANGFCSSRASESRRSSMSSGGMSNCSTACSSSDVRPSKTRKDSNSTIHGALTLKLGELNRARRVKPKEPACQEPTTPRLTADLLADDLKGYNGNWKKRRADREVQRLAHLQQELDWKAQLKNERRRQHKEEREAYFSDLLSLKQQRCDEMLREEQEALELERLQEAEKERRRAEEKALAARRLSLAQPIPCEVCRGSGECTSCAGQGCITALYLASKVDGSSHLPRGRVVYGCGACGGQRDGGEEFGGRAQLGTGRCSACTGTGKTQRRKREIEALLAQEAVTSPPE